MLADQFFQSTVPFSGYALQSSRTGEKRMDVDLFSALFRSSRLGCKMNIPCLSASHCDCRYPCAPLFDRTDAVTCLASMIPHRFYDPYKQILYRAFWEGLPLLYHRFLFGKSPGWATSSDLNASTGACGEPATRTRKKSPTFFFLPLIQVV